MNQGNDEPTTTASDRGMTGGVRAGLHDAARAARPRAEFVRELETHLRRQAPSTPARARRAWGGVRLLILLAIAACALGGLLLGAGMLRSAAPPPGPGTGGGAPARLTPAMPMSTALAMVRTLPDSASTDVAQTGMLSRAPWVPQWLTDPTVVYLLLTLGALAVLLEVLHPGAFVPGVVGGLALILAGIGLLTLPLNWPGLFLLALALGLVATDIQASTHGALTLAALIAFVPGSLLLFRPQPPGQPSDAVALPVVLALAALLGLFGLGVGAVAARVHTIPPYRYALPEAGMLATTVGPLAPGGVVQVAGQLWSARSDTVPIAAAQPVRVLVREGLTLVVQPLDPGTAGESEFPHVAN